MDRIVEEVNKNVSRWQDVSLKERSQMLKRAQKNLKRVDFNNMGFGAAKVEHFNLENDQGLSYAYTRGLMDYVLLNGYFSDRLARPNIYNQKYGKQNILKFKGSMTKPSHEVWLKPGVEFTPKPEETLEGSGVALVLGAGNQTFLSISDMISMLHDENCCAILKIHPLRSYAKPAFEQILSEYIEKGFVRIVDCNLDETKTLIENEYVTRIHMTGGKATHDAIVWGTIPVEDRVKPILNKPMTSELGCITPYIVSSGASWSKAEIKYQAKCLVGPTIGNAGCNCLSPKLLVLDKDWPQIGEFVDTIKQMIDESFIVPSYYPGAAERYDAFLQAYENDPEAKISLLGGNGKNEKKLMKAKGKYYSPDAELKKYLLVEIDETTNNTYAFRNEPFAPVLTIVGINGDNVASTFLTKATNLVNDKVFGTLSATVILHPKVDKEAGEEAIASLRYGTVFVNGWSAFGFPHYWGAHSSESLENVESGLGYVNQTMDVNPNTIEKTVARLPFKSYLHYGQFSMDVRNASPKFMRKVMNFAVHPGIRTFSSFFNPL